MRVNIYAEEMTDRIEIVTKQTADGEFTGVRFYLELPVTVQEVITGTMPDTGHVCKGVRTKQVRGPFLHHPGDDDSSAVTFWGKGELRNALVMALALLDSHDNVAERLCPTCHRVIGSRL